MFKMMADALFDIMMVSISIGSIMFFLGHIFDSFMLGFDKNNY